MFWLITCWVESPTKNLDDLSENRVIMSAMWKKIISASLSVFLLAALNFCLAECAFASEHHHSKAASEVSSHGYESASKDHDSDSEKHDAGSLCCSSLVADQIPSGNFFESQFLKKHTFTNFITSNPFFIVSSLNHPQYREEFPPGSSPPTVFLSAYFTHAPPVIL